MVPGWSEAQFINTIRTGTDPNGHALDPEAMPWPSISSALMDDELRGVYAYIRGLPPQ